MFKVVAQIAWTADSGWNCSRQVPTFYVQAFDESNAENIGRTIILAAQTEPDREMRVYIDAIRV